MGTNLSSQVSGSLNHVQSLKISSKASAFVNHWIFFCHSSTTEISVDKEIKSSESSAVTISYIVLMRAVKFSGIKYHVQTPNEFDLRSISTIICYALKLSYV